MFDEIMSQDDNIKNDIHEIELEFDFPGWLLETDQPIEKFKKQTLYKTDLNQKKINYLKNEIKSIYTDDKLRALGRYFRQHMQRGQSVFEKEYHKIQ